jgi:hypothetical protein
MIGLGICKAWEVAGLVAVTLIQSVAPVLVATTTTANPRHTFLQPAAATVVQAAQLL